MAQFEFNESGLNVEESWLCLDFANTVGWHASDHPEESLHQYSDLVGWAAQVGLLADSQSQRLLDEAKQSPQDADAALQRGIRLREAIYRIFSAQAHALSPANGDLDLLNQELRQALSQVQIVPVRDGFEWNWNGASQSVEQILWPVVRSAADLLTSSGLDRVGECADDHGCGWLFFDTSKNRSRRWCSMGSCGNRAKAQRHYQKSRE